MNWYEIIKFNEEHIKEFVKNKDFWKRFNELENLLETQEDNLRDYEKVKYITLNEFMLKSVLNEVREHCECMIKIYGQLTKKQQQEELQKFLPYDKILTILDKVGDK